MGAASAIGPVFSSGRCLEGLHAVTSGPPGEAKGVKTAKRTPPGSLHPEDLERLKGLVELAR